MGDEKEKMLSGELYDANDPELVADREHAPDLTRRYNRTIADDHEKQRELLEDHPSLAKRRTT